MRYPVLMLYFSLLLMVGFTSVCVIIKTRPVIYLLIASMMSLITGFSYSIEKLLANISLKNN